MRVDDEREAESEAEAEAEAEAASEQERQEQAGQELLSTSPTQMRARLHLSHTYEHVCI